VRVVGISSSPRRDGNSRTLVEAVLAGAADAGHDTGIFQLDDHVEAFVRDCRRCRDSAGRCTIADGYERLLHDAVLPAEALVIGTPIYWYGMSGQLKTFFDRMFCYIAASHPAADEVVEALMGKRIVLVLSSEETYAGAELGIVHQMQEYARYTHSSLVGVVRGFGNRRSDVRLDPAEPLAEARRIGTTLAEALYTDYRLDTPRSGSVWPDRQLR
jgi:multimeric flavodoxin WrbA